MSNGMILGLVVIVAMGIYCIWFALWKYDLKRTRERILRENEEFDIKYDVPYKSDTFDEVMFIRKPDGMYNGTIVYSCKRGIRSTRYCYDKKGMQLISMMIKDGTYVEL